MRYFLSGVDNMPAEFGAAIAKRIECRLFSVYRKYQRSNESWLKGLLHSPDSAVREVMLDSGAFTAFQQRETVTLDTVIAAYRSAIAALHGSSVRELWFINLDVIPGANGRVAELAEVQTALDASDRNYAVLAKEFGRERVLPVYHQTEPLARLRAIIDMSGGFIACGLRQDFPEDARVRMAEEIARFVHAHPSRPLLHGLATTGTRMVERVKFDSVDSATWIHCAAYGKVLWFKERGHITQLSVSDDAPTRYKHGSRGHVDCLMPMEQQLVTAAAAQAGVTMDALRTDRKARILFNAYQLQHWCARYKGPAEQMFNEGLFGT